MTNAEIKKRPTRILLRRGLLWWGYYFAVGSVGGRCRRRRCGTRDDRRSVEAVTLARNVRAVVDGQASGGGGGGKLFHVISPISGSGREGPTIERHQSKPSFRLGAQYFFFGFLPRNNTRRPIEPCLPSNEISYKRTLKKFYQRHQKLSIPHSLHSIHPSFLRLFFTISNSFSTS